MRKTKLARNSNWEQLPRQANYNVDSLAALCGVTTRTLEPHFRRTTGMTPHQWMHQWRMIEARLSLSKGKLNVKEVAHAFGYAHLSSFSADYKSYFSVSPSQVRKAARTPLH